LRKSQTSFFSKVGGIGLSNTPTGWGILGRPVRAFGPVHKPNGSIFSQSIETLNPFSSSKHTFKKIVEYAQRLAWFLDQETYFKKNCVLDAC
jgi:hypothetical protein